jgi:hypothetical protein
MIGVGTLAVGVPRKYFIRRHDVPGILGFELIGFLENSVPLASEKQK